MNKAFVREPEETGDRKCPRCGSLGVAVGGATLDAHLSGAARRLVAETAWFCAFARCDVVYFDAFDRVVDEQVFGKPVYPKDPEAPICSCFGLTLDDVEADIAEGGVTRVRELVEKARSPAARCLQLAPSGQCCVGEVQRTFMQRRAASQQG
jgi:hypothetical protein